VAQHEPVIGAVTKVTHPDGTYRSITYSNSSFPYYVASVSDERGFITQFTRDGNNRITKVTYPAGETESFAYNNFGEVTTHTQQNGGVWTLNYDSRGMKISQADSLGNKVDFTYDSMDRLATVFEEARGLTTRFAYNSLDEITQVTYPDGSTTKYTYDGTGDKLSAINELGNTWSYTYDNTAGSCPAKIH
jgi:YD repeat-containing protein